MDEDTRKPENVRVFVRLRPLFAHEVAANISIANNQSVEISRNNDRTIFHFNRIFENNASQLDVYKLVASPLVKQAFNGYNGTVLAYGQSGTGKTYTILGANKENDSRGIVPNVFSHIFTQISLADPSTSYMVTVTFLEVYNDQIHDLLNTSNKKLEVRESPKLGVYVKNLSGMTVECTEQVFKIISKASRNRSFASTNLNAESSRSHAIFTIRIEARHEDKSTTFGKLNLVDLAGSERVKRSFAKGERLKEAGKINLSLSILGNVISALIDGNTSHIPYRNCKLTRLLQDSLGGNCMTSMIATISPNEEHIDETFCTLLYADRAKKVRNIVRKNEESVSVLRSFENKIRELQKQLETLKTRKIPTKINKRDVELQATEQQKKILLDKLDAVQKKILIGGENLLEKAQLQQDLLNYTSKQLQILDNSERLLLEALENKQRQTECFERESLTLQEEDKLLDFQLEQVQSKIVKAKELLYAKENEYQNEIGNLLYTNKCLAKEIGLANYVINKTIAAPYLEKIKNNIVWDEDCWENRLKCIAYCGNNMRKISLDGGKKAEVTPGIKEQFKKYPHEK